MDLWVHQQDALQLLLREPHLCDDPYDQRKEPALVLDHEMGCGKSRVIVEYIETRRPPRVLILCPLSVVPVWRFQLEKHGDLSHYELAACSKGSVERKRKEAKLALTRAYQRKVGIVVVNYESAWRKTFANWALNYEWDLVVLDESHKIKSITAKVTKFCRKLRQKSHKRVLLTGTLIPHSPLDLLGQFSFVDPRCFGEYKRAFLAQYAVMGGFENRQPLQWIHQDLMRERMSPYVHRVRARDVLDLPGASHIRIPVELSRQGMTAYRSLANHFWAEVDEGTISASNALVKLLRLQQVTGGSAQTDEGPTYAIDHEKEKALRDIYEGLPPDEALVVFCKFRADLDRVKLVAKDDYLELSGRRKELERWHAREKRVLGVQISAGGLGVDLTRARYAVYYSVGFSLGDYEQSLARIHRPGQDYPVTYYHLVAKKTVDEAVYGALRKKRDVVLSILEGRNDG